MATLTQIKQRFWDNDGSLLSGGKVYIYLAGTTTATSSFTDATGSTANTWPVILDAKGEASIWTSGLVKIDVKNSSDVQVTGYPVDYVGEEVSATSKGYPINLNGNFQIAQAGTSFAAPATGAYDLDGWMQFNTSAAVYTVTQGTGSASYKLARITTITTADASVAAGDLVRTMQRIEGYDIVPLVGNTFTVSFSAKFPVTGIHCVALTNSALDRSYVHEVNCTAANTWASYSFTVTGGLPTSGTWTYASAEALRLQFVHMAGTTYTGSPATADTWMTGAYFTTANQVNDCGTIGNVWALEDVRIDLGSVPGTDWPSYQENYARSKRYYRTQIIAVPNNTDNPLTMPIDMRDVPTITGGGAGFTSTGTTKDSLICYQTARANQTLVLASRL